MRFGFPFGPHGSRRRERLLTMRVWLWRHLLRPHPEEPRSGVSRDAPRRQTSAFSRQEMPESCVRRTLEKWEGAGNAGCWSHPQASCARSKAKKAHESLQVRRNIPAFPARWLTAYGALSPVSGVLATVPPGSRAARVDPSIGRSGPHAFAVRKLHPSSDDTTGVHRIPPDVRDDAYAPPIGAGCADKSIYFRKTEDKYFFTEHLT
jgi:hypothetical protein